MRIEPVNNYQSYKNTQINYKKNPKIFNNVNTELNQIKQPTINTLKTSWHSCKKWLKTMTKATAFTFIVALNYNNLNEKMKEHGYVEPVKTDFNNKNEALQYAVNRITEHLNSEDPKEYSVIINKRNKIVSESLGDSNSVINYPLSFAIKDEFKIPHQYIFLHGHPEQIDHRDRTATQSFSFQDFRCLNNDDNYKESYVVNKHGQFCRLRKKENFKKIPDKELDSLETKFLRAHKNSWANRIEIYKDNKVIHEFNDYQGMHAFWKETADKYNLEYYTNFGVFEGVDAYENYYYPELLEPFAPTSHKDFEL